jgi:hypothetical protein
VLATSDQGQAPPQAEEEAVALSARQALVHAAAEIFDRHLTRASSQFVVRI